MSTLCSDSFVCVPLVFAALWTARTERHSQAASAASTRWDLSLPVCLHLSLSLSLWFTVKLKGNDSGYISGRLKRDYDTPISPPPLFKIKSYSPQGRTLLNHNELYWNLSVGVLEVSDSIKYRGHFFGSFMFKPITPSEEITLLCLCCYRLVSSLMWTAEWTQGKCQGYWCLSLFYKWVPKKEGGSCSMTPHTSMWINPAPQLQRMETLTEMLSTWVSV